MYILVDLPEKKKKKVEILLTKFVCCFLFLISTGNIKNNNQHGGKFEQSFNIFISIFIMMN